MFLTYPQDIVTQGKTLVGQYMRCRLKRSGLFSRKCGLQRLRSVASLPGGFVIREVFPRLLTIGQEMERLHPKLYSGMIGDRQPTYRAYYGYTFYINITMNYDYGTLENKRTYQKKHLIGRQVVGTWFSIFLTTFEQTIVKSTFC